MSEHVRNLCLRRGTFTSWILQAFKCRTKGTFMASSRLDDSKFLQVLLIKNNSRFMQILFSIFTEFPSQILQKSLKLFILSSPWTFLLHVPRKSLSNKIHFSFKSWTFQFVCIRSVDKHFNFIKRFQSIFDASLEFLSHTRCCSREMKSINYNLFSASHGCWFCASSELHPLFHTTNSPVAKLQNASKIN